MSDFIIPIRESRKRWKPSGIICQKLPHASICQLAGISGNTLRNYLKEYQKGGIEKVKSIGDKLRLCTICQLLGYKMLLSIKVVANSGF